MNSQLEQLFQQILSSVDRAGLESQLAYVHEQCGDDPGLLTQLVAMIRDHHQTQDFLTSQTLGRQDSLSAREQSGGQIGPYKLLQQIGEGGMGTVFMAEQLVPVRRKVALKLIKPGMDTRQVIARFEAERQALSMMDHPNIARMLNVGTTDSGLPYFVMELVRGQRITTYCDEKRLTTRQRLELLLPVCSAIQHAHQKGIIHRDIKPSNIMIAEYDYLPVPKIIDFGVAKAISQRLTDETMFTAYGQLVGTLQYMSPEQAKVNQLDIDTRSDLYSLGVLLYELLTGSTPFDPRRLRSAAWDEMLRIVREEEPLRPSHKLSSSATLASIAANRKIEPRMLAPLVRGELDWIVMKSLEKDRTRRYATASALAEDLKHYLDDEPVLACPPSAWYRLQKFTRRNRRMLTASSLLILASLLAVAGIAGGIGWQVRERQARVAEASSRIDLALQQVDGMIEEDRVEAALASLKHVETLCASEDVDFYWRDRTLQYVRDLKFLQQLEEARLLRGGSTEEGGFDFVASSAAYLVAFDEYGISKAELEAMDSAALADALPHRGSLAISVAACLDDWVALGLKMSGPSDHSAKLLSCAQVLDPHPLRGQLRQALADANFTANSEELRTISNSVDVAKQKPSTTLLLAKMLSSNGQIDAAVAILRQARKRYPNDFWLNFDLADALYQNHDVDAVRYFAAATALMPASAAVLISYGYAFIDAGRYDDASTLFEQALQLQPNSKYAFNAMGRLYRAQGNRDKAIQYFQRALAADENYSAAHNNWGISLLDQGQVDEAMLHFRSAIELSANSGVPRLNLAQQLLKRGKLDEAATLLRETTTLMSLRSEYLDSAFTWQELGWAQYRAGDWENCLDSLVMSCQLQKGGTGDAFQWIVMALAHQHLSTDEHLPPTERASHASEAKRLYLKSTPFDRTHRQRLGHEAPVGIWDFCQEMEELLAMEGVREVLQADASGPAELRRRMAGMMIRHKRFDEVLVYYQSCLEEAATDLQQQQTIESERLECLMAIGDTLALRGEWAKAAEAYKKNASNPEMLAYCQLLSGDSAGFQTTCQKQIDLIRRLDNPSIGELRVAVLIASLRPITDYDRQEILDWAKRCEELEHNKFTLLALGEALYRYGHFQRAIDVISEIDKEPDANSSDYAFPRALALHAVGELNEARRWYDHGFAELARARTGDGPAFWAVSHWASVNVWKQEADQVFADTQPASQSN